MNEEEHLIKRLEEVNSFIDLPEYSDEAIKTVSKILTSDVYKSFPKKHLFPDPNGEFTFSIVSSSYSTKVIIHRDGSFDYKIYKLDDERYTLISEGYKEDQSSVFFSELKNKL